MNVLKLYNIFYYITTFFVLRKILICVSQYHFLQEFKYSRCKNKLKICDCLVKKSEKTKEKCAIRDSLI